MLINKALFRSPLVVILFYLFFRRHAISASIAVQHVCRKSSQENRKDWIIVSVEKLISLSYSYVFFLKYNLPVLSAGTFCVNWEIVKA